MRDFIFADLGESIPANNVLFRTDAIGAAQEFFQIYEVRGLDNVPWSKQKKAKLLGVPTKGRYTRQQFIDIAAQFQLNLVSQDTNGGNAVTLVTATNDSDTVSW